jgi:hypothetical protein
MKWLRQFRAAGQPDVAVLAPVGLSAVAIVSVTVDVLLRG